MFVHGSRSSFSQLRFIDARLWVDAATLAKNVICTSRTFTSRKRQQSEVYKKWCIVERHIGDRDSDGHAVSQLENSNGHKIVT
jgi:hypothetical protein